MSPKRKKRGPKWGRGGNQAREGGAGIDRERTGKVEPMSYLKISVCCGVAKNAKQSMAQQHRKSKSVSVRAAKSGARQGGARAGLAAAGFKAINSLLDTLCSECAALPFTNGISHHSMHCTSNAQSTTSARDAALLSTYQIFCSTSKRHQAP